MDFSKVDKPYISVIIIAQNRTEYIDKAMISVLNQTLERDFFEIIVIKNFSTQSIEDLIVKNSIISLNSFGNGTIGENLYRAIICSKGEVLCFLDDDDTFEKDKLREIYSKFLKNNNLVYYHNSQYFINEYDQEIQFWPKPLRKSEVIEDYSQLNKLLKLINFGLFFNLSSISVRRLSVLPFLEQLKQIKAGVDDFIFLISLMTPQSQIIMSKKELTKYLIHQNNDSLSNFSNLNIQRWRERNCENLIELIKTRKIIFDLSKNNRSIRFLVMYLIIDSKKDLYLLGGLSKISTKELLLHFKMSLKRGRSGDVLSSFYSLTLFFISKICYKCSLQLNIKIRYKKLKHK